MGRPQGEELGTVVPDGGLGVLHLTTERGWRGGERQLLLLARALAERGLEQVVAAPAGSPTAERAMAAGHAVVPLNRAPLHPANLVRLLSARITARNTVIHAHTSPGLTLAAAVRALSRRPAILYTRRTDFPVRPSRKYTLAADFYVAVSAAAEARLLAAGTAPERVARIPDAVDPDNARRDAGSSLERPWPGHPLVAAVGELAREKGHHVLLAAWTEVLRQAPEARLVIAGEGDARAALEREAAAPPLAGTVRLVGHVEPVGELVAGCDLLVMPSLSEGLGSAALEAMWLGLPVVASAVGGLPEAVVDGETGLLVPPDDPAALARAIVELLADPERRTAMGRVAAERTRARFAVAPVAERYLEAYRRALENASARRRGSLAGMSAPAGPK